MSVRNLSARTPAGLCAESVGSPLYPTRPDPTRPILYVAGFASCRWVTYRARRSTR
jgi:hypothetical protein